MPWYHTERPQRRALGTPVRSGNGNGGGGGAAVHIGADAPAAPVPGQLWWRSDPDGTLYVWYDDGTSAQFVPATPPGAGAAAAGGGGVAVHVGPDAPPAPVAGQLWWRTDPDGALYLYYDDGSSAQFVPATATVTGPPGASGPAGPQGVMGATGPVGPSGVDGADGSQILSGSGLPTAAVGVEGDYYVNTDTDTMYGPKAAAGGLPARMLPETAPTSGTSGDYTLGNRFTINTAGRITHLRYWHSAGCGGITHALTLWTDAGVVVASTTDTPAAAFVGYREVAFSTPYIVAPGEHYRASYKVTGPFGYSALPVTSLTPDLTFHEGYFGYGDSFPENAGGANYQADIVYEPGGLEMWPVAIQGGAAAVHIGPDAPPTPSAGQLWWRNDPDGTLLVYYNDGTSSQFVPAVPTVAGPAGPTGPQGATGTAGAQGPAGPGVAAGGTTGQMLVKTSAVDYATGWQTPSGGGAAVHVGPDAPPTPAIGQLWWRNDPDGNLYVYYNDGTSSQFIPATAAPTGPAGATGPQGATGATGAPGATGATGSQGSQGTQGIQGPAGTTGSQGPAGPGVAVGGATGQVLTKTSATDYATNWQTPTAGGAAVHIGADAPPTPTAGQLWWRTDPDGALYVYYNDGTSSQFVPAAPNVGPPGPAGPSQTVAYRHVQASAATTWSIAHGLSFRPNVAAVDSTGREIWPGTVDYPSATSVTLTFSAAVGGEAYLS